MPPVAYSFEPASGSVDVRPDARLAFSATNGTVNAVTFSSPAGPVPGTFAGGVFTPDHALDFGQQYQMMATVTSLTGGTQTYRSSFTTLYLPEWLKQKVDMYPYAGSVVGSGMPVMVSFVNPVPAEQQAALAAHFTVTTSPAVEGAWRWMNDSEMHWRPRVYWPANTSVTVSANLAGLPSGDHWFSESFSQSFTTGDAHRITIDAATHQMTAYENGQVVRTMPISTGRDAYPTASGTDLIMEKHDRFEMDSSSVGITGSEAYLVTVSDAQRLTNSGTFIHAAPWNGSLGEANLSHGCVNASNADASWMMEFTRIGDPVEITNTPEQVSPSNGWGQWNIPFSEWATAGV
jgi:lipoprotein-anchoring transpeptidase ErfK/SrfK